MPVTPVRSDKIDSPQSHREHRVGEDRPGRTLSSAAELCELCPSVVNMCAESRASLTPVAANGIMKGNLGQQMTTKLTVQIDADVAQSVRQYSERRGRTHDQMVSDVLKTVTGEESAREMPLTPVVRELKGALKGKRLNVIAMD